MEFAKEYSSVESVVTPLVESLGLILVACNHSQQGKFHTVQVVLYHKDGIGTDQCAQAYRLVLPRLEIYLESKDISLEISSPGIHRRIKHVREYAIFQGKEVRILSHDEWVYGTIDSASEVGVTLILQNEEKKSFAFSDIQKATLHT